MAAGEAVMGARMGNIARLWFGPLAAFGGFILVVETILVCPVIGLGRTDPLDAGDLISLLTGAITAAGLTGIYTQFRQRENEAALRLDAMHAAFNAPDMQISRDIGWTYLTSLSAPEPEHAAGEADDAAAPEKPKSRASGRQDDARTEADARRERLLRLAHWWVHLGGDAPKAPGTPKKNETRKAYDTRHVWALTAVINFYVRLENQLALHYGNAGIPGKLFARAVGPFVWSYWRSELMRFVDACEKVERPGHVPKPYFIAPLQSLDRRYAKSFGIEPEHGKETA